ncbi:peroxisome biogenesis protein 2-like isoform X2 [Spinacia oleracea]|uniref:Peroxisome biogenesis protein 2-like isoform X2 n=1 Tax=Spinacia oleracea TaxID=3562 RepID=A0ABM3QWE1_SPIOL|nr:peroxisome biogenesis protein 2-like isoform X2 [Spinacia oleracea]
MWYCIAAVGGQYIWTRLQSFSAFRRWGDSEQRTFGQRAWLLLQHVEGFYKAASFSNLLLFLLTEKTTGITGKKQGEVEKGQRRYDNGSGDFYTEPSMQLVNPSRISKKNKGQISPNEFSPGLLDLHSHDAELLTELWSSYPTQAEQAVLQLPPFPFTSKDQLN